MDLQVKAGSSNFFQRLSDLRRPHLATGVGSLPPLRYALPPRVDKESNSKQQQLIFF